MYIIWTKVLNLLHLKPIEAKNNNKHIKNIVLLYMYNHKKGLFYSYVVLNCFQNGNRVSKYFSILGLHITSLELGPDYSNYLSE